MQEKQQIAQIVLYKEKHLQVLIFHFTLCLVSVKFFNSTNFFFANFCFAKIFTRSSAPDDKHICITLIYVFKIPFTWLYFINEQFNLNALCENNWKSFKNIYRNQDLSFALIKLPSKIKYIFCNHLTAFQEKKDSD